MTDASKDGADRCCEFIDELKALFEKHNVQVEGSWYYLGGCELFGDDDENGWRLDMRDIPRLTEKKPQG